ncbi:zinc finger protein jing-like, partial [Pollicipes pollicipes]
SRRCLWQGCKVFDRPGSAAWLERHVLTHGGSKPFRCIVDGCSQRFSSQSVLERHVNGHFNPTPPVKRPDASTKLSRRSSRRAIQEEHPYSARIFDFCDATVMERLRYQLVRVDGALERLAPVSGRGLQLSAQVIARRTCADNKPELLVRWKPADIVDDEWMPAHAFRPTRHVPCCQLPAAAAQRVANAVGGPPARHRRKGRPA